MEDEEILRRLDLIQATLALAFAPQLRAERDRIRSDDISAEILDLTEDWIPSTNLQDEVSKRTKKSTRSVRERLPGLVAQHVLEVRDGERQLNYRRTGLV